MESVSKFIYVDLGITNPFMNLAVEEYLYNNYKKDTFVMILWQNQRSVVIGQNQSVYSQCNLSHIKNSDIFIIRRKSGGGAVYHDLGNLNYTFISSNYNGVCEHNMRRVCSVLNRLGITAEISGRNDIIAEGKKISGNAFYADDEKICHHGTLLVNANLNEMYEVLTVSEEKWLDKGIDSVKSRTINIKDIDSSITVEKVKRYFRNILSSEIEYGEIVQYSKIYDFNANMEEILQLYKVYSSTDWIFEKNFHETMIAKQKFNWGNVEIHVLLQDNVITKCCIFSDALETSLIKKISMDLNNQSFDSVSLQKAFDAFCNDRWTDVQKTIANDIKELLLSETAM